MAMVNGQQEVTASLIFFVNGTKYDDVDEDGDDGHHQEDNIWITEPRPDPEMTLLTYLRIHLHLTGSKLGCGEGGCGACTVMVSHYNPTKDRIEHCNVNACLAPVCSMHGRAVTTVEGICTKDNEYLHPVQERLAKFHGSQCGFCTPGIVMSMYTLLRNNPEPTAWEMESFFDGNLCRCTGYRPILDAFHTFTKVLKRCVEDEEPRFLDDDFVMTKYYDIWGLNREVTRRPYTEFKCGMGDQCCRSKKNGCDNKQVDDGTATFQQKMALTLKPYNPTQELIFPAELKVHHTVYHRNSLTFQNSSVKWIQPKSLAHLLELKSEYPHAKLVCGNTEIRIETKFKNQKYPVIIYCSTIPELSDVTVTEEGVNIGASVTLSMMDVELKKIIKDQPDFKVRSLEAFVEMLKWFASHQIRNVATLSGNIMTASPISDLNPLLVAAGATAHVKSADRGNRSLQMNNNFFQGYRKTAVTSDEILESVTIPFTKENEYFYGYKQANRKDDDIAVVNAGMSVVLSEDNKVQKMALAFGGMGVSVVTGSQTAQAVNGDIWDDAIVPKVCNLLANDLHLPPGSPGGVARFRKTVALSFFFKFYTAVNNQHRNILDPANKSAVEPLIHQLSEGIQVCGAKDSRELTESEAVGNSVPHLSASLQSKGEAVYVDDMPLGVGELHMSLVTSSKANAKILSVDISGATRCQGYQGFVSSADLDEDRNSLGIVMDTVFASKEVTSRGQVIGGVIADTLDNAQKAAKMVKVEYEERTPIITIMDAIRHNSYHLKPVKTSFGDLETGFKSCDHILEGTHHMNGQNHFYLETMATRAIPHENGGMEVYCSTQNPTELQHHIAKSLGVPMNKIVVRTKRLGGGFGGKETQYLLSALPTALAARKTGKIVRCILDRDEDMTCTGNRHPFLWKYKVGFSSEGKMLALDVELYNNGGNSLDLSLAVMDKAVLQVFLSYFIPHVKVIGRICKTNIMSNTAFRGFGSPQGMFMMENIIQDIADYLNLSQKLVREKNFYQPEDPPRFCLAHNGDLVRNCWNMCINKSDFLRRRQEVDAYNRENRWKKKGLALTPMRFGISFSFVPLNQSGALVHIYNDGSVLIAHGGVEMGQGLYVKMAQIASEVLEIPLSYIHNNETSTTTVPNTFATAASVGTDLNGMAVQRACVTLKERLSPFKDENLKGSWEDWVQAAINNRVSLSATGFYKTPGIQKLDFEAGTGIPFLYATIGAACSEVQIDCLTGDHKVLRTDIVMDVGQSINPAIDVGQIQGAFMQGYGLYMLEEVKVTPEGFHLTQGPGTYKIPSFGNIPSQFNVHLVPDSQNEFAVFKSKGVGEPPLLLAASVFFATKDAIKSARKDVGKEGIFQLNSPAMPAKIRMACSDQFTDYFPEEIPGTFKPWFVDL